MPASPSPSVRPATWIFLRGLVREAAHWGDFLDRWGVRFPDDRRVALDIPGNGTRHTERSRATVRATIDALRQEAPMDRDGVYLFALSLGGMLALDWLARFPDEVSGVVLVNSSAGGASPPWRRLRPWAWPRLVRIAASRSPETRERIVAALTTTRAGAFDEVKDVWTAVAQSRPVTRANAARQLWAAARFHPPLRAAQARGNDVLVLVGAGDRLVAPSCSRAVAHRLGAAVEEHPDAGHDLPLDAPEWVLDQVQAWRARRAAAPENSRARQPETFV